MFPQGISLLNENQMISNIRNIGKDLFPDQQVELSLELSLSQKSFPHTPEKKSLKFAQESQFSTYNPRTNSKTKSPQKKEGEQQVDFDRYKRRKKRIFESFEKHISNSNGKIISIGHQLSNDGTPLIQTINSNVYGRIRKEEEFKKNVQRQGRQSQDNGRNQQMWKQFLERGKMWSQQRSKRLKTEQLQSKTKHISNHFGRQSSQLRNKQQMIYSNHSSVQNCINKLKVQTQKLRAKLLGEAKLGSKGEGRYLRKTFEGRKDRLTQQKN